MSPLDTEVARRLLADRLAVFVDIRAPAGFARGHLAGSLSIPFSARGFGSRAAALAVSGSQLVLAGDDEQKLHAAEQQAAAAGLTVRGTIGGEPEAWARHGLPLRALEMVSTEGLTERLRAGGVQVLDVREPMEWETGCVPGAVLIPLGEVPGRLDELDSSLPVLVICEAGVRSSSAASILQAAGFARVANAFEGTAGWRRAGQELQIRAPGGAGA